MCVIVSPILLNNTHTEFYQLNGYDSMQYFNHLYPGYSSHVLQVLYYSNDNHSIKFLCFSFRYVSAISNILLSQVKRSVETESYAST